MCQYRNRRSQINRWYSRLHLSVVQGTNRTTTGSKTCCNERMEEDHAENSQTSFHASLRWFATKPYEGVHLAPKSQGSMRTAIGRISCLHSPCAPNPIFGRMRRRRTAQHGHSSPEDSTSHIRHRCEEWVMYIWHQRRGDD